MKRIGKKGIVPLILYWALIILVVLFIMFLLYKLYLIAAAKLLTMGFGNTAVSPDVAQELEDPEGNCEVYFSSDVINVGESVVGYVKDGEDAECIIYYKYEDLGWQFGGVIKTDKSGYYSETRSLDIPGDYYFVVQCGDCVSERERLTVLDPDGGDDSDDGSDDGSNGDAGDGSQDQLLECGNVNIPGDIGDKGSYCSEYGFCEVGSCENYWDYTNKEHNCGCTESFFCGQYCYEYYYTTECECPPGSERVLITRSTFVCVPDKYYCQDGVPVEIEGPWPD